LWAFIFYKKMNPAYIFPNQYIDKAQKLAKLNQKNTVVWLTGLSGSGKSTISKSLEQQLFADNFLSAVLDGDNLRTGLCNNLSFSEADRAENVRRTAEAAKILLENGFIVVVALISPLAYMRQQAKDIIGAENFLEIFIDTPLNVCIERDVKGLYKKAQNNQIVNFTAISQHYEAPTAPFLTIHTQNQTPQETAYFLYQKILPFVKI
jgi:adenylylsulfate kinase